MQERQGGDRGFGFGVLGVGVAADFEDLEGGEEGGGGSEEGRSRRPSSSSQYASMSSRHPANDSAPQRFIPNDGSSAVMSKTSVLMVASVQYLAVASA